MCSSDLQISVRMDYLKLKSNTKYQVYYCLLYTSFFQVKDNSSVIGVADVNELIVCLDSVDELRQISGKDVYKRQINALSGEIEVFEKSMDSLDNQLARYRAMEKDAKTLAPVSYTHLL